MVQINKIDDLRGYIFPQVVICRIGVDRQWLRSILLKINFIDFPHSLHGTKPGVDKYKEWHPDCHLIAAIKIQ